MDPTRPQSTYGQSPSNVSVNQRDRSGMAPGYNSNYAQSPAALAGMSLEDEEEMNRQLQASQATQDHCCSKLGIGSLSSGKCGRLDH